MSEAEIDYFLSHVNADMAFDVKTAIEFIEEQYGVTANIPRNKRNTKKGNLEPRYFSEYIYESRFKIETIFAWLDSYKRLLIRFEQLARHFKSWLHIASFLINLRAVFN
jgi:transposase